MVIYLLLTAALLLALYALYLNSRIGLLKKDLSEFQKILRQGGILTETATILAGSLNMASAVEALLDGAKSLTEAEHSAIVFFENREVSGFFCTADTSTGCKMEATGTMERVFESKKPLRAVSLRDAPGFKRMPDVHLEIKNILIVPVLVRDKPIAELMVCNKHGDFTEQDEICLMALGSQAALAINRAALYEEVQGLAVEDSLTKLYNFRTFQSKLAFEAGRSERFGHEMGVIIMDIDGFKNFNEAYGYKAGDRALKMIADIIRDNTRQSDFAARYGGEEFAVILVESSPEATMMTAERIRRAVDEFEFITEGQQKARLTLSMGVSSYPVDAPDRDGLLKEADSALYIAKKKGGNMVMQASSLFTA